MPQIMLCITLLFLYTSTWCQSMYAYEACSSMREMPTASNAGQADVHDLCPFARRMCGAETYVCESCCMFTWKSACRSGTNTLHTPYPTFAPFVSRSLHVNAFSKRRYVLLSRSITTVQSQNWRRNSHRDLTLLPALTKEHSRLTLLLTTTSGAGQVTPVYTLPSQTGSTRPRSLSAHTQYKKTSEENFHLTILSEAGQVAPERARLDPVKQDQHAVAEGHLLGDVHRAPHQERKVAGQAQRNGVHLGQRLVVACRAHQDKNPLRASKQARNKDASCASPLVLYTPDIRCTDIWREL